MRSKLLLWEVRRVERDDKIRVANLRACAERLVIRIWRNSIARNVGNKLSRGADEADRMCNQVATDVAPRKDFFVLIEDFFCDKPLESVVLNPSAEHLCAGYDQSDSSSFEGGNPRHKNRSIDDALRPFSSVRGQLRRSPVSSCAVLDNS
jgi:hypothetical protein